MLLTSTAACLINSRLTAEQLRRFRERAGANIAVCAGPVRLCFRLDETGEWRATSPLVAADAEAAWHNGKMQVTGDSELLQDVNEVWQHNTPWQLFADAAGVGAADAAADYWARLNIRDLPGKCNIAPAADEVSEFNRQAAELSRRVQQLSSRLSPLENSHGK